MSYHGIIAGSISPHVVYSAALWHALLVLLIIDLLESNIC
jgi:hypothetical protein